MSQLGFNAGAGLSGMLKEGSRHMQDDHGHLTGSAGIVLQNIDACGQLSRMLSSSYGPHGRCKLVVNHLNKIFVTADGASILEQVSIEHPAAHLLKTAVQKQQEERGDGTVWVASFAGALLWQTAVLIRQMTWQPAPDILAGYRRSMALIEDELLPAAACGSVADLTNEQELQTLLKPVLQTKHAGCEETLAPLVAQACLLVGKKVLQAATIEQTTGKVVAENAAFPVDAVRTIKILGASVAQSRLVQGYVAQRRLETVTTSADNAKVAVFATGLEASSTEAKGTVLLKSAQDLMNYNPSEEQRMHDTIKGIAEALGPNGVVVSGGNVSDMALHYLDRYKVACLRIGSKWELRRLCQAVGATALVRLGTPTPDELGFAASVRQEEIGDQTVTIFCAHSDDDDDDNSTTQLNSNNKSATKLATLVLRASTKTTLQDLERAVDHGVQTVAQARRDARLVYGGGAVEMALSQALQRRAASMPGLEPYAVNAFAKALEVVPHLLAEQQAGRSGDAAVAVAELQALHAAHQQGRQSEADVLQCDWGMNCDLDVTTTSSSSSSSETTNKGLASMKNAEIRDLLVTKLSALRLAVDAVVTILNIDQIIMSKPAGMGGGGGR